MEDDGAPSKRNLPQGRLCPRCRGEKVAAIKSLGRTVLLLDVRETENGPNLQFRHVPRKVY